MYQKRAAPISKFCNLRANRTQRFSRMNYYPMVRCSTYNQQTGAKNVLSLADARLHTLACKLSPRASWGITEKLRGYEARPRLHPNGCPDVQRSRPQFAV